MILESSLNLKKIYNSDPLFKKDSAEMKTQTHKFEEDGVLSQSSDAAGEPQDKHHTAHHQKEPDRVKPTQVGDGGDVGEHALTDRGRVKPYSALVLRRDQRHTAEKVHRISVCPEYVLSDHLGSHILMKGLTRKFQNKTSAENKNRIHTGCCAALPNESAGHFYSSRISCFVCFLHHRP